MTVIVVDQSGGGVIAVDHSASSPPPAFTIESFPASLQVGTSAVISVDNVTEVPTVGNTSVTINGQPGTVDNVTGAGPYDLTVTFPIGINSKFNNTTGYELNVTIAGEERLAGNASLIPQAGFTFGADVQNPDFSDDSVFGQYTGVTPADGGQVYHSIHAWLDQIEPTGEPVLNALPTANEDVLVGYIEPNGTYHAPGTLTFPDPANYPQDEVTIDSIVTTATTATVSLSYSGIDSTGFQYRLDGGAWIATGSVISLTGLASSTSFDIDVRPVNGIYEGIDTSNSFVTTAATDTTPDPIANQNQTGVARSTRVNFTEFIVQGIDPGVDAPVTISGASGDYAISTDGGTTYGAPTSAPGTVRLNHRIIVGHTSSPDFSTPILNDGQRTTTINVGGETASFTSTTVGDTEAPVITLTGGNQTITVGDGWSDPGYSATDNSGETFAPGDFTITGSVDPNTPGVYTLTYEVTDASGNVATTTRNVTVITPSTDVTPPVVTLLGLATEVVVQNDTWLDPGATSIDVVDGDITGDIVVTGTVDTSTLGTYTLTYTSTDAGGNTAFVTRNVIVVAPNTGQYIDISGGKLFLVSPGSTYTDPAVYAEDSDGVDVSNTAVWSGDTVDTNAVLLNKVMLEKLEPSSVDSEARTINFESPNALPEGNFKMRGRYKVNGTGEFKTFTTNVRVVE